ncbi:MAG TPA: DUF4446 family protein [Candidatus Limnocylindria bacterium]|jgi:hypothetical protein|nr:DUF4446 family protein [Candidatus Limnocylindria bacterium]
MDELNRFLVDNLVIAVGVLLALILVLLLFTLVQSVRLRRAVRAYRTLVGDGSGGGGSLTDVLERHVGRVAEVQGRLGELEGMNAKLTERSATSIQHIGLVRFNPFEDTGSDQSFAIALLDDRRDGVVISSLHGRSNTRVFAKPVEGGSSSHTLSDEETQAIRIAVSGTGNGG